MDFAFIISIVISFMIANCLDRTAVATGDSAKEVFEKAKKEYPEKMPVLAFILRKEALVL